MSRGEEEPIGFCQEINRVCERVVRERARVMIMCVCVCVARGAGTLSLVVWIYLFALCVGVCVGVWVRVSGSRSGGTPLSVPHSLYDADLSGAAQQHSE